MGPNGSREFTIEEVAIQLGMSRSSINHHFATKTELLAAIKSAFD
jgi:AcrR family transcriptional regulator